MLDAFELGRARRQLQVTKSMSSAPWFLSDADEDGTRELQAIDGIEGRKGHTWGE